MRVRCGDQQHEVTVRSGRDETRVTVDGVAFTVAVEEVARGTFVLRDGDRVETFHCVSEDDVMHLSWKGSVYRLETGEDSARAAHRPAGGGLEAPMPGKVIKLSVVPGQRVSRGEEVLVVEAMKMENALRAPRDGTVKSVSAQVGDMVSPGLVLVELE